MLKNLKEIDLKLYRTCCDEFYTYTMPLREVAPDFLDLACINNVVVDFYLLINRISCAQACREKEEEYLKKYEFSKYINTLLESLMTIHQISVFTKDSSLFDKGVEINEFGLFMEVMSCFADLLNKTVGGSKETNGLINEYLSINNKERDLDLLWEKLKNLEDKEVS